MDSKIVQFVEGYIETEEQEKLLSELENLPFEKRVAGTHVLARSTVVLAKPELVEQKVPLPMYWGNDVTVLPFGPTTEKLRQRLVKDHNFDYNVCLLNLYRDGIENIGWHCDREEKGSTLCIASLSLGATRCFELKKQEKGSNEKHAFMLSSGSLLVMRDPCQELYYHRVPKDLLCSEPRYNLTFRQFHYD